MVRKRINLIYITCPTESISLLPGVKAKEGKTGLTAVPNVILQDPRPVSFAGYAILLQPVSHGKKRVVVTF